MSETIKYIFRELPPESSDLSIAFDYDYLIGAEDYNTTLFVISDDGYGRTSGYNHDEYERVVKNADALIDSFNDVGGRYGWDNYKQAMDNVGIPYNSRKCHALKEWVSKWGYIHGYECIAEYLTIVTGKEWNTFEVRGYSQGDYVNVLYCTDAYDEQGAQKYGEIYLGCAKEFCLITLNEDGTENEMETCYGYIVADCECWRDEDYKAYLCEMDGIDEAETRLEMIDDCRTVYKYSYRVA